MPDVQVEDLRAAVEWLKQQGRTTTGISGKLTVLDAPQALFWNGPSSAKHISLPFAAT